MLDVQLSELYSEQLSLQGLQKAEAKQEQRDWLAQRNLCGADAFCLFNAYSERITQLGTASQASGTPAASKEATSSTTSELVQASPLTPSQVDLAASSTPSAVKTAASQSSAASPVASMDRVLRILSVIVPESYSEPDEEEIRLAIMRDISAGGGRMLSPTAVEIGATPFDKLMPIRLDATKVEKESCEPVTDPLAYTCTFRLYLKVSLPPQSKSFLNMGGGNAFFDGLMNKYFASVNNATPGLKAHVFVLTDQGWRSPSMRKESIDATLKTYAETLSDWPECRLMQVGNQLRCH